MGGEKGFRFELLGRCMGSPPRGRGKEYLGGGRYHVNRITPAWAGKSWLRRRAPSTVWDHPRVGGEKYGKGYTYLKEEGSPPRGRGKVASVEQGLQSGRITPAWAGKSSVQRSARKVD